ncbi:MAG: NAD-dependent succinate-semialdehyde dehydrogenase [Bacteroidota bacterium]
MTITTTNPATKKELETYTLHANEQVEAILSDAHATWKTWRHTSFQQRAQMLQKAADLLEASKEQYAEMMTLEMGKVKKSAISEIEKCAWVCRYYAENGADFLKNEHINTEASKSYISYQPLGVILAVMPWNYPFWQVFRFAAPTLMAGNVGILKHASNVPGCALMIEDIFKKASGSDGIFKTLLVKSDAIEAIIEDKRIKAVTLTGSGPAGAAVAATAGKNIKHTVLELGGSDPYLVLEDADLEHAATQCTESRLLNTGQSCIGAKRFIVVEEVYDQFLALFQAKMLNARMGDPMQDSVHLGPMARHDLRDEVHEQVQKSIEKGANLLIGGTIPDQEGAYYPATILTEVAPGMPAFDDEIFGPVASVIKATNQQEAIEIANNSDFGLGACVFTQDLEKGERIAREELQAGCCFVNQYVKSDPRLPFGGIKTSGFGRELSYYGIREFVNIKTVYVK